MLCVCATCCGVGGSKKLCLPSWAVAAMSNVDFSFEAYAFEMSKVLLLYLLYFLWFCVSLFFDDFFHVCLKPCRTYSDVAISSSLAVVLAVFVWILLIFLVIVFLFLTHLLLVCCCVCHLLGCDNCVVLSCWSFSLFDLLAVFLFGPPCFYVHCVIPFVSSSFHD